MLIIFLIIYMVYIYLMLIKVIISIPLAKRLVVILQEEVAFLPEEEAEAPLEEVVVGVLDSTGTLHKEPR